jgi:hypothetical protein
VVGVLKLVWEPMQAFGSLSRRLIGWIGVAAFVAAGTLITPSVALAAPDAKAVAKARDSFDDGSRAYRKGKFELAASQFEAADAAVPSARALRMAMRARAKAGQGARAGTLAEQAIARYPDDAKTLGLAKATVAEIEGAHHRVTVRCVSPCVLAIGTRALPGAANETWVVYLPSGPATISASFEDGGSSQLEVQAVEGGSHDVELVSEAPEKPKPVVGPEPEPAVPDDGPDPGPVDIDGPSWIESPWVFGFWAVAAAGVGGVTVWSGLDTLNNPGSDVVEQECVGQGVDCPEYQQGLSSQLRTNILIGATAGTAVVATVFAIFVTDWDGEPAAADSAYVTPSFGTDGGMLSLGGSF